MKLRNELNLA